jgi:PDDEXK-like domain of unknown function (DUF3799)
MIKGKIIKQHDTILRPETNYREIKSLNCSMIKLFNTDPVKFFEQFKLGKKRKDSKTTSLIIGDICDFYLLDCRGNYEEFSNRFDEKFALFEDTKGTGQVFILCDILYDIALESMDDTGTITREFESIFSEGVRKVQALGKYKGASEEKTLLDFDSNGKVYYNTLLENHGKIVVETSLLDKATKVANLLKNDPFTSDVFADDDPMIEYFPKYVIEFIFTTKAGKEIECKAELDMIKIDHSNKIIYPKDLKTSFSNEDFDYSYLKYRYDLQGSFYLLAVMSWAKDNQMEDYAIQPMEFIVGDTSANNRRPLRYPMTMTDIQNGLNGYTINGHIYKGISEIIEEISWAEDTNNWNVSKEAFDSNGILPLQIRYDK